MALLHETIRELPPGGTIIDYGCFGWLVARTASALGRDDLRVIGCDTVEPPGKPDRAQFAVSDPTSDRVNLPDDVADLTVASHVVEHVLQPMRLVGELLRVTRPSGLLYLETPSELMALSPSDPDVEGHGFESFWDDPTHVRPYSPAALYRIAVSFGCVPLHCSYGGAVEDWAARNWISQLLARKPEMNGRPPYAFISLKDTPRGVHAALDLWRVSVNSRSET